MWKRLALSVTVLDVALVFLGLALFLSCSRVDEAPVDEALVGEAAVEAGNRRVILPPGLTLDSVVNPARDLDRETLYSWVDRRTRELHVALFYRDEPEPDLELVAPDGQVITATAVDSYDNVSFYRNDSIPKPQVYFTIHKPMSGKWIAKVDGQALLPAGKGYHIMFSKNPSNPLLLVPDVQLTEDHGYASVLLAAIAGNREEYADLTLRAAWRSESSPEWRWLRFTNDGRGQDDKADDPVFTSVAWPTQKIEDVIVIAFLTGTREGERFERKAEFAEAFGPVDLPELRAGGTYVFVQPNLKTGGDVRGEPFRLVSKDRRFLTIESPQRTGDETLVPLAGFIDAGSFLKIEPASRAERKALVKAIKDHAANDPCLSFASSAQRSGEDPWGQSVLLQARAEVGSECLSNLISNPEYPPNLNDIHGKKGLLSQLINLRSFSSRSKRGRVDESVPSRLLLAAGYAELVDGTFALWTGDMAQISIPETVTRHGVPKGSAVVSITKDGMLRVGTHRYMSSPLDRANLADFLRSWRKSANEAATQYSPRPTPSATIHIAGDNGLTIDGQPIEIAGTAERLQRIMPSGSTAAIRIQAAAPARYGVLVRLLDHLSRHFPNAQVMLSDPQPDLGAAIVLTPQRPDQPSMTFKLGRDIPWSTTWDVLAAVATEGIGSVVFLTWQEIPDDRVLPPGTFPGGLPGGLHYRVALKP